MRTVITYCAVVVTLWISVIGMDAYSQKCHTQSLLINPNMPGAFISFERIGPRPPVFLGEGSTGIWLSIHNNYRVPIEIPTYGVEKQGEVGMIYDTVSLESSVSAKSVPGHHIDVSGMSRLDPGESLLFSVPAEDLPKSAYLRVQFHFDGEDTAAKGGPAPFHFAIIYGTIVGEKKRPL